MNLAEALRSLRGNEKPPPKHAGKPAPERPTPDPK